MLTSLGHTEEQNHGEHCGEDQNDTVPTPEELNKSLEKETEKTDEDQNEVINQDRERLKIEPEININGENILNNQASEMNVDEEGNPCGDEDHISSDKATASSMNVGQGESSQGKKRKLTATTEKTRKKKTTTKTVKESRTNRAKEVKVGKSDRASKKGFKDQFLTVKFNVSQMQPLAGASQDFLVFVKDNVHSPDARPAALHAGKYVTFGKGEIFDQFLSHQGLKSNPHDFFFCANEVDFIEDRTIPFVNAKRTAPVATAKKAPKQSEPEEILSSESEDKSEKSDSDIEHDLLDVHPARRVSWAAPDRESSESDMSSGGVNVYGRGAEKTISKEKKKKKLEKKKRSKDAAKKTSVDILENQKDGEASELVVGNKKKVAKPKKGAGGGGSGAGKTAKRSVGKSSGSGTRKGTGKGA